MLCHCRVGIVFENENGVSDTPISVSLPCRSFYDVSDCQGVICNTTVATRPNTDIMAMTLYSSSVSRPVIPALSAEVIIPFGVCACGFVFELPFVITSWKVTLFQIFQCLLHGNPCFTKCACLYEY